VSEIATVLFDSCDRLTVLVAPILTSYPNWNHLLWLSDVTKWTMLQHCFVAHRIILTHSS